MTYNEIENLLFCSETNDLVLDGDYYTDPFFAIVNHRVGDMFLFYTLDGDYALIYGAVIIDPITKGILWYSETIDKAIRVVNSSAYSDEYKKLYEQLHDFVFKKDLTLAQLDILRDYYEFLQTPEFAFAFAVYNLCMPEFITWVKHQLSI